MTRIVTFGIALMAIVLVLGLRNYKGEISNERFDYEKTRVLHEKKVEELEKLNQPLESEAKVVEVKKEGPLVELTTPELQRGSELYKKCIACHGVAGEGKKAQNAPKIGGQYDWYITLQISNMKNKVRVNKVMDPFVSRLSDQDMKDLGTYISKLPW